jgi:hypothetical protein
VKARHQLGLLLIALAYLSFVSLGLPDGLNGVAWPSIRATFNPPLDALGAGKGVDGDRKGDRRN